MRKNLVGVTTLAVALSSVALLNTSYAEAGPAASYEDETTLPFHPLIQEPIQISDVATFKDASTLWLTDALVARGAQSFADAAGFSETIIFHESIWEDFITENFIFHADFQGEIVGGPPELVRPLMPEEFAMMRYVFSQRLHAELGTDLQVDPAGIRGSLSISELNLSPEELKYEAEWTAAELGSWMSPVCQ